MKYTLKANNGEKADRITALEIKKEEGGLRLFYSAYDSCFYSPFTKDNDPIYDGCAVEIFFSPDGNANEYYEYEFSPNGLVWAGKIRHENGERMTEMIDPSIPHTVKKEGKNYFVEAFIPVKYAAGKSRFNAFRIEREGADKPYLLYAVFPTLCETFHVPSGLGVLE